MKPLAHRAYLIITLLGLMVYSHGDNAYDYIGDNVLAENSQDSLKLTTLFDSAKFYMRTEPMLCKSLMQRLIMVGEQQNNPRLHEYYNIYGTANVYIGDFEEAKRYYTLALKINQLNKDSIQQVRLHNNLGYAYFLTGNYELSLQHYHLGLAMMETLYKRGTLPSFIESFVNKTPDKLMAQFYGYIGEIHVKIGNYSDGIKNYSRAVFYAEKDANKFYYAGYLNDLARLYTEIREYDKALQFCNRAIEVNREIDNQLGIGVNYQTLGEIYARKDKIESAEKYLNKGLELIEIEDDMPSKANALFRKIR